MADCIFCKIIAGEIPAEVVWQDERVIVFKDIHPKAPVHLLIVSKKHIGSVKDLKDEDRALVAELIYAARNAAAKERLAGYKLVFNVGREGGQIIDHLHLHLLGGWSDGAHPVDV